MDDLWRDGVAPAELQIVCHSLYETLPPGGHVITENRYEGLGGAEVILDKFLERALDIIPAAEKRIARGILVFMAAASGLKAAQSLDRILVEMESERDTIERVMAHLVDVGLLRPVGKGREREYELMHEILADKVQDELAGAQVMLRDVQDLLTREMNNFTQFGILIGPEELRLIGNASDDLVISPEELQLIIRSALTAEIDADEWFDRVIELGDNKADFIAGLMRDGADQVRLHTYNHLSDHLEAKLIRHLVHGLDDALAEVRSLARTYVAQLEPHLLAMLENRDYRVRALAARALGHIDDRKATKPLIGAFIDRAPVLRDELTNALLEIDDPRAPESLLKSVSSASEAAWSAAYALGQLSVGEADLNALQRAATTRRKPELVYALGLALATRRNFSEAEEALNAAGAAAPKGYGPEAIAEARHQLEAQRDRASAGEDAWTMFGRVASHGAATEQEVTPPLELAWKFETKDHVVASPVVRDNTAFIGSRDKHFYAIDTGKGTARWRFEAGDRIERAAALTEDMVCFGALDGAVYALDIISGQQRWQATLDSPIRSGCLLEGDGLYVGTKLGQFARLDAHTGDIVWEVRAPDEVAATAASAEGLVVVGCWDGHIFTHDAETGHEVWRHKTQDAVSSSPSIADGIVYCGSDDHGLYALDLHGGALTWRTDLGGQVRSSPAISAELVIAGSIDGKCYALSREDGAIVWEAETDEEVMSSPAISGQIVYVGSKDGALYALALQTGEVVWRHKTAYGVYSSPAIAEQTVLVGFDYYGLAAFRPRAKAPTKK